MRVAKINPRRKKSKWLRNGNENCWNINKIIMKISNSSWLNKLSGMGLRKQSRCGALWRNSLASLPCRRLNRQSFPFLRLIVYNCKTVFLLNPREYSETRTEKTQKKREFNDLVYSGLMFEHIRRSSERKCLPRCAPNELRATSWNFLIANHTNVHSIINYRFMNERACRQWTAKIKNLRFVRRLLALTYYPKFNEYRFGRMCRKLALVYSLVILSGVFYP